MTKWIGNITAITFGGNFMRVWIHDKFVGIFATDVHPLYNPFYLQNRQMLFVGIAISLALLIFFLVLSCLKPYCRRDGSVGNNKERESGRVRLLVYYKEI